MHFVFLINLLSEKLRISIVFLIGFIRKDQAFAYSGIIFDKDSMILTCARTVVDFDKLHASSVKKVSGCIIYDFMLFVRIINRN